MKLHIPALVAAIAIALTGCGGGEKQASPSPAASTVPSAAPARAKVPDVVGKTYPETESALNKVDYRPSVYGPNGVKWGSLSAPDATVITISTSPAAGLVSANETVIVKVNVNEKEFLAAREAKAEAARVAASEAEIATRYTYTCGTTKYTSLQKIWASGDYKFGGPCSVSGSYTLIPSEQKLVDVVTSKGAKITTPSYTIERIMGLCAKLDMSYADVASSPERKGEAEAALTVCPDAPHAAVLQEVATLSKIGDGNLTVGKTMEPGTWKTKPGVKSCYWSRSTGGGDIIANDIIDFAPEGVTVTVYDGEGFKSSGCGTWTKIG